MRLDSRLKDAVAKEATKDFRSLYSSAMCEFREGVQGAKHNEAVWSALAPNGDIYRYHAFLTERRKHCEDVSTQLAELADDFAGLLGGATEAPERRVTALLDALRELPVREPGAAVEAPSKGFRPILEYQDRTQRTAWFLEAEDYYVRRHNRQSVIVAVLVAFLQIVAPALMIYNNARMPENRARFGFRLRDAFCFGATSSEHWTLALGASLLFIVNLGLRFYLKAEKYNARKAAHIPFDSFWIRLGTLTNGWCMMLMPVAFPLLFWSEETATSMLLDTMALVFVWRLDDLNDFLSPLFKITDSEFQRVVAWNAILLTQCPVDLRDVVNKDATRRADIWKIEFDQSGRLLIFDPSVRARNRRPCRTRLEQAPPSERAALTSGDAKGQELIYTITRDAKGGVHLPTWTSAVITTFWQGLDWCLLVLLYLGPFLWFVGKDRCHVETVETK